MLRIIPRRNVSKVGAPLQAAERLMPDEQILWEGAASPSFFRIRSYYVLTSERLMVHSRVTRYRKIANCRFGQVLA